MQEDVLQALAALRGMKSVLESFTGHRGLIRQTKGDIAAGKLQAPRLAENGRLRYAQHLPSSRPLHGEASV